MMVAEAITADQAKSLAVPETMRLSPVAAAVATAPDARQ
jgi:hypothetical protein